MKNPVVATSMWLIKTEELFIGNVKKKQKKKQL